MQQQHVVIIGGGFGGIRAALDLSKNRLFKVTLISAQQDFEYYPGLHKLLGNHNHGIVRLPLATIFENTSVTVIYDQVDQVSLTDRTIATRTQKITADAIILAVGSQTEYFGISGLKEMAYSFKSVNDALRLRTHIEQMFQKHASVDKAEAVVGLHMVIVGAGPNGVDLAGELAVFTRELAKKYQVVESLVTIDLIEASNRVLAMMPEKVSHHVEQRLRSLGVNVFCNRDMKEHESWTVNLADMTLGTKTVIWTAGITTNELVTKIEGLVLGRKNRVAVDSLLQVQGFENIFVIGDAADTQYSGLAQTALYDGAFVAQVLQHKIAGKKIAAYVPKPTAFNIGVGPRWSVMMIGKLVLFGIIPHTLRTLIDMNFFASIISLRKTFALFFTKKSLND